MSVESRLTPEQRSELVAFLARERPTIKGVSNWFARQGHRVCHGAAYNCRVRLGPPGKPPSRRLKVDLLLTPEDRVAYLALIHDVRNTSVAAERWLKEHGYTIGTNAVRNHFQQNRQLEDQIHFAAQTALAIGQICKAAGSAVMSEGMLTRFEQLVMEQLVRANKTNPLSTREMYELSRTVSEAVKSRKGLEEEHRTSDRFDRRKQRAAERAAKQQNRATPMDVAERIREVLGA
jgi:hypothetical protein